MPRHTEPSANTALANILRRMMHGCDIRSESTQTIAGNKALQPEILITAADRAPVVIEAEFMPAYSVEDEAAARLTLTVTGGRREIEAAIALRYPAGLEDAYDLTEELRNARLTYCVLTAPEDDGEVPDRFPESGWLEGSAADIAELTRLVSVPQSAVKAASDAFEKGIDGGTELLKGVSEQRPAITLAIANLLGMSDVPQTRRMACAIVANAMVFHDRVAGMHEGVKPLHLVCGQGIANPQANISKAWTYILDNINYWPIFAIARDIIQQLPTAEASRLIRRLQYAAGDVAASGANVEHDLTGRVFQRLIADRKYLATFYTLPASAALLARLAVEKLGGIDWADAEAIAKLKVGDFACGTGALLSAVYEQIATRHEQAGGNPAALHRAMMEDVLYGCDVMPSAIHITSSTLSGRQPTVGFGGSRLYNMPYGRQRDGTVAIGSLELLQSSSVMTLFNTSDPALRTGSVGEETAANVVADIPDEGFDIVIMNPPFTRATNHEGAHADITNPAFAAFNATREDQTAMGRRLNQLGRGSAYHGNAGIASAFAALGHRKLKVGGALALVLPLSAAVGLSWRNFRDVLTQNYTDINVLSIAANGKDMSFSSDTGMAECLVVARKLHASGSASSIMDFTSFTRRPVGFEHAAAIVKAFHSNGTVRGIEDGPYGGTPLMVGDEKAGERITAPHDPNGGAWAAVRLSDSSLAQTAYALADSRLWLPSVAEVLELKTATLGTMGKLGLVHRDITGPAPRGPFDKVAASPTATYPALWNHNATKEKRLVCEPDSQLLVRQGLEEKAATVWTSASRSHINLDFTFGSQPLAVAFTERKSIGGRVWPNVIFGHDRHDYAFAVWGNSTLGLLMHWWHSSRQQSSKAGMTIRTAETLPILDLRALTDAQLATAKDIFDDFRERDLKPAYLADADENRALLDRRVVCDLLGFGEDVYEGVRLLAAKWCAEPSVHGGKKRPRNATLII
ncbi:MAG: hypothetical protein OXI16_02460 [Chloroflexota bacterium]|nr:hypothetical protein [Chloroflexota bacterium]